MRRRDESERAEIRFWVYLSMAFFSVLMLMVWEHVKAISLEKELRQMKKEADRLTYENGRMQMQIHQWISPSHLDTVARKDHGMVPLDSSHVIGVSR